MRHVVILGGGIAGLSAAGALAGHVESITLVDRDRFPAAPAPRAGVPQSRHVHTLLMRGMRELEAGSPGLQARLTAAGALRLDWTSQRLRSVFGWAPRFESGLMGTFCSRDLLEHELRHAVASRSNVTFVEGAQVVGLLGGAGRIVGVRLRRVGRGTDPVAAGEAASQGTAEASPLPREDPPEVVNADLVIDATGRSSALPTWLGELGVPAPRETVVSSELGYASRMVRMPEGFAADWRMLVTRTPRPSTRGGVLYPIEGGRWAVTLAGIGADLPPHDEAGFGAFASILPGGFGELLAASEPLTHISAYRRTANRWRHWERLRGWPDGVLVVGDALCCFNPVYGQGMTVAAVQGGLLRSAMAEGRLDGPGASARMQRRLASVLSDPWSLATGEDFRNPGTEGRRSPGMRAAHWYADRVVAASVRDPLVYRRFLEVTHFLKPRTALVTAPMLRRVLGPGPSAG